MSKFKIKESYLLLLIVLGLISLGGYTTYALFTSSVEIGEISLDTTLQYTFKINSNEQFTIGSNSKLRFNAIIENDMNGTISYGIYYKMINPSTKEDNLIISEVTDEDTLKTSGPIEYGEDNKIIVPLVIINNTTSEVTVEIGVRTGYYNDNNKPENIVYQTEEYLINTKIATSEVSNETCEASGSGECTTECLRRNEDGYRNTYCLCLTKSELITDLDETGANEPDLVDGLIPVMYDGSKWVKADETNTNSTYQWYDYNNKMWANAVLVSSNNRVAYKASVAGTEIAESDILAYYVWIPRFRYKVWNIDKVAGTDSYDAYNTGIDIEFESEKEVIGGINCNYDFLVAENYGLSESCTNSLDGYYTHPAFTFGSDNIRGFWIGKFEITGTNSKVTVLPNVTSLRNQTISSFNTIIQNMQSDSNEYGLNTSRTNTNSHMITNYEWGAVAYLTNSKYGRCTDGSCTEVTMNNCRSYITGIGADSVSASSSSLTCTTTINKYNGTKGVLASTTGNITGIYDMSGGAREYVMGNMSSVSGSYTFYPADSGFLDAWASATTLKYFPRYAYGTTNRDQNAYNRSRLGDATGEVITSSLNGWYGDSSTFLYDKYPWFQRGGNCYDGSSAGIFSTNGHGGNSVTGGTTRAILVSLK